jgi:hypothetical protein
MPINEKNLTLINDLEKDLKEQLLWMSREGMQQSLNAIDRLRGLRKFVISLSVAIIAIVFPLMLGNEILKDNIFFILSLIFFGCIVIYGIINLVIPTISEIVDIPVMVDSNLELVYKMIKQVQDIKKIKDNNEAGKKYQELKSLYSQKFPSEHLSFFQKLWRRYESLFFFGFFIVGFVLLVLGFLLE